MYRKFLIIILLVGFFRTPSIYAQEAQKVLLRVDGLSCSFCAYGLEKKLKSMEGVEKLFIDMEKGQVEIRFQKNIPVDLEEIKKRVKDAGFTLRNLRVEKVIVQSSTGEK